MAGFGTGEAEGVAQPAGYSDSDDAAGEALWQMEGSHGVWQPEAWRKNPEQLMAEAKAMNAAAMNSALVAAPRHSNGPAPAGRDRPY